MAIFNRDKQDEQGAASVSGGPSSTPVQQVINMRGQGLSNNQIIQNLQREGYKSHQIFDAMNQADLRQNSGPGTPQQPAPGQVGQPQVSPYYQQQQGQPWPGAPGQQPGQQQQQQADAAGQHDDAFSPFMSETSGLPESPSVPSLDSPPLTNPNSPPMPSGPDLDMYGSSSPSPPAFGAPPPRMGGNMGGGMGGGSDAVSQIEEVAEAIIDEKWAELMKHVGKIIDWKNRVDGRIVEMENKFNALKEEFDKLHESILGKISDYDQHITDVGTEIKGMEKVFQKIIPELTGNVAELAKLTEKIKDKKKK